MNQANYAGVRVLNRNYAFRKTHVIEHDDVDEIRDASDSDLSETEIEQRRENIRRKILSRGKVSDDKSDRDSSDEQDGDGNDDNDSDESEEVEEEEESETESEEESDDEIGVPRLKPVFIPKKDRLTLGRSQMEELERKKLQAEKMIAAEESRKESLRLLEQCVKTDQRDDKLAHGGLTVTLAIEAKIDDVNTDDENDEVAYEQWKLRELKRLKRDKDERDQLIKEKDEVERLRKLSEEGRRAELRSRPKTVTNKAVKGKYKFLQKYYHRGVFYLDKDDDVFKRDFSSSTLDDHFDKTVLPKVMQVKNFGKSGRTKYTHLVDQDTTQFDSPWCAETAQNLKFYNSQAAGLKQSFTKPSFKEKR